MNHWTKTSIELANQSNYLDLLYKVYPISPNLRREIDKKLWKKVELAFNNKDNALLINQLIKLDLFPIKDSYVAYLRKDPTSIDRNPKTVNRIASQLYEMGIDEMYENCTEPKEANRQIGPMFKEWIDKKTLGFEVYDNVNDFTKNENDGILNVSDAEMKTFASIYLGYSKDKGLDFVARVNKKYIIGEAKFITDFGGHQDRQFDDAITTAKTKITGGLIKNPVVISIAIMDGVLYIKGKHKYAKFFDSEEETIVISSLLLRDFLYSL